MGKDREQWMKWAMELQSLAQAGLNYAKDVFDIERYTRIREISAEIMSKKSDISLVKERGGKWSLPGGWVEVDLSIEENTVKEVKEEAGVSVNAEKIIAVQDGIKNNSGCGLGQVPYGIIKIFVLCSIIDEIEDKFIKNNETSERKYFKLNNLPELSEIRNTEKQIKMCFEAYKAEVWEAIFD